jgi:hypothetical protein
MSTALFDPVKTGRAIDAAWKEYSDTKNRLGLLRETVQEHRETLIEKLQYAHAHVPDFSAYLKEHTKIGRSTAYRILAITDGRGDEVRASERARQQKSRAVSVTEPVTDTPEAPALVPDPPTPAEAVELAASQGVTMTEPEVTECIRLAEMPGAEFEAHVTAETQRIAPPVEVETVTDGAELAAFEISYQNKETYKEVRERAASVGIELPPMKEGRGWRMARVYVPIDRVDEFDAVIGGSANRVPLWAAKARDARKPHDTTFTLEFIHDAAQTVHDLAGWQDMLDRNDEYSEPDRFTIDDNVVAGAKEAAEAWAKLYETILRQGRKRHA